MQRKSMKLHFLGMAVPMVILCRDGKPEPLGRIGGFKQGTRINPGNCREPRPGQVQGTYSTVAADWQLPRHGAVAVAVSGAAAEAVGGSWRDFRFHGPEMTKVQNVFEAGGHNMCRFKFVRIYIRHTFFIMTYSQSVITVCGFSHGNTLFHMVPD